MKIALKILATAMVAMFFASCTQQAVYYDASGNSVSSSNSLSGNGKYVDSPVVEYQAPKKVRRQSCTKCLSTFCPKPGCCGTVGKNVLSRATMQGGSGEPHLGLIPTMKTLAPEL